MSQKRDNSGALFVNDRREKETHPDRTGQAMVGGVEYWVSGWLKESGTGTKYLSLAFTPKDKGTAKPEPAQKQAVFDDPILF